MFQTLTLLFIGLVISLVCPAQQLPGDLRSEQVALCLSRNQVVPGDTLDVEGLVTCMAADSARSYSRYVYVECVSTTDSVMLRQKVSCNDRGHFATRLPIGIDWTEGPCVVRAYTRLMTNFASESFATQPLWLGRTLPALPADSNKLACEMVVVGGPLHEGAPQHVALWLHDEAGRPIVRSLYLSNAQGDTLATVKTSTSGLALLTYVPPIGEACYLKPEGGESKFAMPLSDNEAPQLLAFINDGTIRYQISGTLPSDGVRLISYDRISGLVEYGIDHKLAGVLPRRHTPEVQSLFLADRQGRVLAETTLYVPQKRSGSLALTLPDTLHNGQELSSLLAGEEPVIVRIVPADAPALPAEAALRYVCDYASELPFPADSYALPDSLRQSDLRVWLSAARFKRFPLTAGLLSPEEIYRQLPEEVLTFGGTVWQPNERPLRGGQVVAYNVETTNVYEAETDEQGRFSIAVDDFSDSDLFFIQARPAKGRSDIFYKYVMRPDTFPEVHDISRCLPFAWWKASTMTGQRSLDFDKPYRQLPGAVVQAKVLPPDTVTTERFYHRNYMDRSEIEKWNCTTMAQVLEHLQGVYVAYSAEGIPYIRSRRGVSVLGSVTMDGDNTSGYSGIPILLDGIRVDASEVMNLTPREIESVEYLTPRKALKYISSLDGCLYIQTRRGNSEHSSIRREGIFYSPLGLSPAGTTHPLQWKTLRAGHYKILLDRGTGLNTSSHILFLTVNE